MSATFMHLLQRLFRPVRKVLSINSILSYCLHMAVVLSGTTLGLHYLALDAWIVPISLGAIAAALTDFDDRFSIRLRNLGYVCILFFSVSSILELLHTSPWWFGLYLSLSSMLLVLCGALGARYANITFGTILVSIYSMFALGEYPQWYLQPCLFVLGALWYGLSSMLFYLLKPTQAVQDQLALSFKQLAQLLTAKAELFDPDQQQQVESLLYRLSLQNSQLVQQLNLSKASLLTRLKASRANTQTIYWLNLYFFAQDIHEQASSNYLHYDKIQHNFSRSDLIYRFQKNIRRQAQHCQQLAHAILQQQPLQLDPQAAWQLHQLQLSFTDWMHKEPNNIELKNLSLVLKNLNNLQQQFTQLSQMTAPNTAQLLSTLQSDNMQLLDDDVRGLDDLWLKLKSQLGPHSALFRHAVRIGLLFAVGYAIAQLPFTQHGYWILLTSLFVCQVSYFATKSRLYMRTFGTLMGVLVGIPLLYFVPNLEGQLLLIVLSGVSFFYLRAKKYAIATLMATLMVLLIFNLKGAGYSIILPRIIDTLVGCGLAWLAVSFIWPDWNFRNISKNIEKSSVATLQYFDAVVAQYQTGKNNSTHYRLARRNAHNAQIELSAMISSLSTEPHPNNALMHDAFRYLVYSHSQLSYISALGSHREQLQDPEVIALMQDCKQSLHAVLILQQPLNTALLDAKIQQLHQLSQQHGLSENLRLALKQISLLLETLTELQRLKQSLLAQEIQ